MKFKPLKYFFGIIFYFLPPAVLAQDLEIKIDSLTFTYKSGNISVIENSEDSLSGTIQIPYIQYISNNPAKKEAIFILTDGPGKSNLNSAKVKSWMLENSDVVLIGYRGIDGSVNLDIQGFNSAIKRFNPLDAETIMSSGEILKNQFDSLQNLGIDLNVYNIVEMANDIEALRLQLGYEKINFYSEGFGSRIAYTYGLKFEKNVEKIIMLNSSIPEYLGIWEADYINLKIENYNALWQKDEKCLEKSSDIYETIKNVIKNLPETYNGEKLDKNKIRISSFFLLNNTKSAVNTINAFADAQNGDYSGINYLSNIYDSIIDEINWGDFILKQITAKSYNFSEFVCDGSAIGSPLMNLFWGSVTFSEIKITKIDKFYTVNQNFDIPTLLINGNLDLSNPYDFTEDEFLPFFKNGNMLIISNFGHDDVFNYNNTNFQNLLIDFLITGKVSKKYNFTESINFDSKFAF